MITNMQDYHNGEHWWILSSLDYRWRLLS